jgi:hypothetical protein
MVAFKKMVLQEGHLRWDFLEMVPAQFWGLMPHAEDYLLPGTGKETYTETEPEQCSSETLIPEYNTKAQVSSRVGLQAGKVPRSWLCSAACYTTQGSINIPK